MEVDGEWESSSGSSSFCNEVLMDLDWCEGDEDVEMKDVTPELFWPLMVCSYQLFPFTPCLHINSQMFWPQKGTSATI